MRQCVHSTDVLSCCKWQKRKQDKHKRMLNKMANWRAAKARIRQERIAAGLLEREPKLVRYYPLEFGVRVKSSGETHFVDLKSVRHAAKALSLILKYA